MSLRQRVVRGAAWTLPASVGSRAVGLVGTLLLARYLTPTEFGVVMAAAIAATTASSVTTFGVGTYLVAHPNSSRAETFHASCWFLLTGTVAMAATMMLGETVGRWAAAPGLTEFLPLLIVATFLERIVYLPERILVRTLRFGWLSLARAAGELTYTAVSVTLAASGVGAAAVAWGTVARSLIRFLAIVPAVDIREWLEPHRLRLATFLKMAWYGANVTVASVATFGMRRWDNLLISHAFGPGVMGAYNYAYNLADTAGAAVGDQLNDIITASLPRVDRRSRGKALVHSCAVLSLVMVPLSCGLVAIAPTLVETFFDPTWANVAPMLMLLSAVSIARPLGNVVFSYFYASQRPATVLCLEWASLCGIVAALSTAGRLGINLACACVSLVFVLRMLASMWIVCRQDRIPLPDLLLPIARPLVAGIIMAVGVTAERLMLPHVSPTTRLTIEIASGAAIYAGAAFVVARSTFTDLLRAVRAALGSDALNLRTATDETPSIPAVLSLSSEFPNPTEPGKGLFVRSRLAAMASRASVLVVAPVAALDYANPHGDLFAARRVPRERQEGHIRVLHPRWLYPPHGGWMNAFFLCGRLLPHLLRLRARRRFDLIDAHFAHPEGIAAVVLGKIFRCPVFVTVRGSELRYQHQRVKRFCMSWALRRAARVVAVSDGLRDFAIALGVDPRRVKTVPNGIDATVFCRRDRVRCRASHGMGSDERIILSAGDLAELKGHHRAIAALRPLHDRGVRARLLIAGGIGRSGRYVETLRRQVSTQGLDAWVTFLGEVTQQTLAELMSAADVFCLASSTEGWPNVVNEALACGTPVVATDVGAVRQMVASERYGTVVPVHDGEALTDALHRALTVEWDHEAISAWGRSRSWEQVAEGVLDEMRQVMVEARPNRRVMDGLRSRSVPVEPLL